MPGRQVSGQPDKCQEDKCQGRQVPLTFRQHQKNLAHVLLALVLPALVWVGISKKSHKNKSEKIKYRIIHCIGDRTSARGTKVGRQCSSRHSSRGTVLQGDSPPGGQPSRGSPPGGLSSRASGRWAAWRNFPSSGTVLQLDSSWRTSHLRTFLPTDIPPAGFLLADIPPADSPPDGQSSRGKVLQGDSPLGGQSSWSFSKHGIPTRPLSQWSTDSCDV